MVDAKNLPGELEEVIQYFQHSVLSESKEALDASYELFYMRVMCYLVQRILHEKVELVRDCIDVEIVHNVAYLKILISNTFTCCHYTYWDSSNNQIFNMPLGRISNRQLCPALFQILRSPLYNE
jgi:hypothetical protein